MGDLARASGLAASAIRFYEAAGLLPKARRISGKRFYNPETVDRLMLIRFSARLGIRLEDVRKLLAVSRTERAKEHWRRLVDSQLEEITALISAAQGVERVLLESRDCDCVTPATCRFLFEERQKPPPTRRRLGLHDALKAELV